MKTVTRVLTLVTVMMTVYAYSQTKTPASTPARAPASAPAFQDNSKPPAKTPAPATSAKPSAFVPTADQAKDLRIAQLEAVTSQQTYAMKAQQLPEYQQFQAAMSRLVAVCARVKAENKWPSDVDCDLNSNPVTFQTKK